MLPIIDTSSGHNQIIAGLTSNEQRSVLVNCETVELVYGDILQDAGKTIDYAYFPVSGYISLSSGLNNHQSVENGLVGKEGMLGGSLILATGTAPMRAVVRGHGLALRVSAAGLLQEISNNSGLKFALNQYVYLLFTHLSRAIVCNHFHHIEEKLACWLLMTQDRSQSSHLCITHKNLSTILGVRRSGITVAIGALQIKKLVACGRGEISIVDRTGLETASCDCYQFFSQHYTAIH